MKSGWLLSWIGGGEAVYTNESVHSAPAYQWHAGLATQCLRRNWYRVLPLLGWQKTRVHPPGGHQAKQYWAKPYAVVGKNGRRYTHIGIALEEYSFHAVTYSLHLLSLSPPDPGPGAKVNPHGP